MKHIISILSLLLISISSFAQQDTLHMKVQGGGSNTFDSAQVNAKLAEKLDISDTTSMLSSYAKSSDVVNTSDTATMLSPYISQAVANATYATLDNLAGKANDNAVVHLTGTETVNGSKTLLSPLYLTSVSDAAGDFLTRYAPTGQVLRRTPSEALQDMNGMNAFYANTGPIDLNAIGQGFHSQYGGGFTNGPTGILYGGTIIYSGSNSNNLQWLYDNGNNDGIGTVWFRLKSSTVTGGVHSWQKIASTGYVDTIIFPNKKWVIFGDSFSADDSKYWGTVRDKLKLTNITTFGISGQTISQQSAVLDSLLTSTPTYFSTVNIASILVGINDFGQSQPLGSIEDTAGQPTYAGYLRHMIEKILTANPKVELYILTPPEANSVSVVYKSTNSAGWTVRQMSVLISQICSDYSVQCVDLYDLSQFNLKTIPTLTVDGLHPNSEGSKFLGNIVANAFINRNNKGSFLVTPGDIGTMDAGQIIDSLSNKLDKSDSTIANRVTANSTAIAGKADTSNISQTADYVIEKVGSTFYARPGFKSGLPTYSNTSASTVIQSSIDALNLGGIIKIKNNGVVWDNIAPINFTNDYITIDGEGKYNVGLKLKASADVDSTGTFGLFNILDAKHVTIRNLQIDGNAANQTKIATAGDETNAIIHGINAATWEDGQPDWDSPDYLLIENCYVHDITRDGVHMEHSIGVTVRNCDVRNFGYGWNGLTAKGLTSLTTFENNYIDGNNLAYDIGISLYGIDNTAKNNTIVNCNWGGAIEWEDGEPEPYRNKFISNTITNSNVGIQTGYHTHNCEISYNYIDSLSGAGTSGIVLSIDTGSIIKGNTIERLGGSGTRRGINISGCYKTIVQGNKISATGSGTVFTINVSANSDLTSTVNSTSNLFDGNYLQSTTGYGFYIEDSCNNNILLNNVVDIAYAPQEIEVNAATGTIYRSNRGILSGTWIGE